jgi:NADPH:quinone reductase-like Zn-dependent oxidoreductase
MTAVVSDRYGPPEVLRISQVPKPSPKPKEVRIQIFASAVTASDIFIRSANLPFRLQIPFRLMMGLTRPRHPVLGFVFSGVIDEVGSDIRRFAPGDSVYGGTGFRLGAYAEYRCMIETDSRMHGCLAAKPRNLTHEEATAAFYGGLLALQYVDMGAIQPGQDVLVYGASGTSGTLAIQYARSLGARVTAVCSTRNIEFVKSLGADQVLDYTQEDAPPPGDRYALVLDSVGTGKSSRMKEACRRALLPGGRYVSIDDGNLELSSARLEQITALVEAGTLTPVVGATYPLVDIVEAQRFVEAGHKRGGVAITIHEPHESGPDHR